MLLPSAKTHKLPLIQHFVEAKYPEFDHYQTIDYCIHLWLAMNTPMIFLPVHLREVIGYDAPILQSVNNWLWENHYERSRDLQSAFLLGKRRIYMGDEEALAGFAKTAYALSKYPRFYVEHDYEQQAIRAATHLNAYRAWTRPYVFAGSHSINATKWEHYQNGLSRLIVTEVAHNEAFRVEEIV